MGDTLMPPPSAPAGALSPPREGLGSPPPAGSDLVDVTDEEAMDSLGVFIQLLVLLLCFLAGYVMHTRRVKVFHEAGVALLIGIIVGFACMLGTKNKGFKDFINFKEEFFFLVLLPPIIFESGFSMQPKPFFHNFGAICTLAFVGTLISTLAVALFLFAAGAIGIAHAFTFTECMIYGSLISATDPVTVLAIFQTMNVHQDLYALVFGESVLNDAVAIVLYRTMLSIRDSELSTGVVFNALWFFVVIFVGSFIIGTTCGFASALLMKHSNMHETEVTEGCVVVLFPFLAYCLSEYLKLSGIVSILFCGIVMAHYTKRSLSPRGLEALPYFFKTLASLCETFVFVYMGATMFLERQSWRHIANTIMVLVGILGARALNVYPLTAAVNAVRKHNRRIPQTHRFMLWFSGLRGAIAFALSLEAIRDVGEEQGRIFLTTTLFVVLFTVIFIGGATSTIVERMDLGAKTYLPYEEEDEELPMDGDHIDSGEGGAAALSNGSGPAGSVRTSRASSPGRDDDGSAGSGSKLRRTLSGAQALSFRRFDEAILTPMFTSAGSVTEVELPEMAQRRGPSRNRGGSISLEVIPASPALERESSVGSDASLPAEGASNGVTPPLDDVPL